MATEKEQCLPVSQPRTSSRAVQHNKNTCIALQKTPNSNVKHTKHPATVDSIVDSTKSTGKSKAKNTEKLSQLAGQHGPFSTLKTSAHLLHLPSSISNNTLHQKNDISSAQATVNAEACVDNMSLLSLKDPTKTTHIPQNMQPTEQGTFSKCSTGKSRLLACELNTFCTIFKRIFVFCFCINMSTFYTFSHQIIKYTKVKPVRYKIQDILPSLKLLC